MAPKKKPVLSLSTLAPDRPVINIDGQDYEIIVPGDLGLIETSKLDSLRLDMAALNRVKGPMTQTNVTKMSLTLLNLVQIILPNCDNSVIEKLRDQQRLEIVGVFTDVTMAKPKPKPAKPTTTKSRKRNTTTEKT